MRSWIYVFLLIFTLSFVAFGATTNLTANNYIFSENVSGVSVLNQDGEHAAEIGENVQLISLIDNSRFNGASGGDVSLTTGSQQSSLGGNGLNYTFDAFSHSTDLKVQGGTFEGGNGGNVTNQYNSYNAPGLSLIVGNLRGASGGHGFFSADDVNGFYSLAGGLTITNGNFYGGDGGVTTNTGSAVIYAQGGHGVFLNHLNSISIKSGNFRGGLAGVANGVQGLDGYDALFTDNNSITISDGTFTNRGVKLESVYFHSFSDSYGSYAPQTTSISGGIFSQLLISSIDDDMYTNRYSEIDAITSRFTSSGYYGSNDVSITGGQIDNLVIDGSRGSLVSLANTSIVSRISIMGSGSNTFTVSGNVNIGELSITGATYNALSLGGSVTSSGQATIHDGTTDVNLWDDDHFTDTTVSSGVLNFNNQDFNLINGSVIRLTSTDAVVNFKGTNTAVKSGAQLDLGVGRTTANSLTVESGGSVKSTVSGDNGIVSMGSLEVEQLTLDAGASWTLYNDGTFTEYGSLLNSNAFLLGVSSNTITSGLTSSDVELTGEGMDAYWLYGISDLVVTNDGSLYKLYARYGMENLGEALNAEGDLLTLMNLIQPMVDANVNLQNMLINYGSADTTSAEMTKGFLRTAEMGSTLAGAQSVLSDQIGLRTREHLRSFRLAGKTGPSGARGPASWWDRSMNRLHDALPSFNLRDSMRSAQDRASEPTFSNERPSVKKPWISGVHGGAIPSFTSEIVIPPHYQTWGRAYVADLDQESTDGFAGYDASVRGGVLGVDRRFDHSVVGLAGGMSQTRVTGADGHSGEADSLHSTVYASYFTDRVYLNAHISFASSDVETDGVSSFGYRSEYDANSLSFFVGAGVGYKGFNDAVMITPEVSLLSSKYSRDGYTSSSSMSQSLGFEDMVFDSYDQRSYQSELGVAISSMKLIENPRLQMAFQPEFRVHWVHEFEPNPDAEGYQFTGSTQTLHTQLQSREENLIRFGGGVRCWNWNSQTTEFGLNLDHLKGDAYTEWMFSGHFIHRF